MAKLLPYSLALALWLVTGTSAGEWRDWVLVACPTSTEITPGLDSRPLRWPPAADTTPLAGCVTHVPVLTPLDRSSSLTVRLRASQGPLRRLTAWRGRRLTRCP